MMEYKDSLFTFGGYSSVQGMFNARPLANAVQSTLTQFSLLPQCSTTIQFIVAASGLQQAANPPTTVCFVCAPGSYYVPSTGNCTLCGPGTYASYPGTVFKSSPGNAPGVACNSCPPGFYIAGVGSRSPQLCLPCPANTFQPGMAAASCQPCTPGYYCPFATSSPLSSTLSTLIGAVENQPTTLVYNSTTLSTYSDNAGYTVIALSSVFLLAFLITEWFEIRAIDWRKYDWSFTGAHNTQTRPRNFEQPVRCSACW
jgi:hypothetical protein